MDDNLADYRRFCASRLKRLERCKKTKSFCNLDDEAPLPVSNSGSGFVLWGSGNFAPYGNAVAFSGCHGAATPFFETAAVPPCSGTNIFCTESKAPLPKTGTSRFVAAAVRSMNNAPSVVAADSKSSSMVTVMTSPNKQTAKNDNSDHHLSLPSCSSPCFSSTISSSITPAAVPSTTSLTQYPASVTTTTKTITMKTANNDNDDEGDANRRAQSKFDLLREKMISLMENDVRLLQQLLALGDSIQELKSRNQVDRTSQISLNSLEEEDNNEEEWWTCNGTAASLGNSLSTVTNLYVDDEPKGHQNKQYFSRKNSVLRIPIPPRSSNRMSTNKKLQRRLSQLSQRCKQLQQQQQQLAETSSQTEESNLSKKFFSPVTVMTTISAGQTQPLPSHKLPTITKTVSEKQTFGTTNTRISNGSIDSGIRDESCSTSSAGSLSPVLKEEKL